MQLSNERLERNKEAARAFYDLMFNECKPGGGDRTLRRRDVHPAQPRVGDGKQRSSITWCAWHASIQGSALSSSARSRLPLPRLGRFAWTAAAEIAHPKRTTGRGWVVRQIAAAPGAQG
jgi:hypothetical protein